MDAFVTLVGVAAPLSMINVDTDMIIPKQFLKTTLRSGLGANLFEELRYREDGSENPDFVLCQSAYREASILIAGDNFGCGSSREHAVWALQGFGIRCVISTSFADIFFNNCFKNGILPVVLPAKDVDLLMGDALREGGVTLTVDLQSQQIARPGGPPIAFDVDPFRRKCLLEGLDEIDLTLRAEKIIEAFEEQQKTSAPWLYP